MKAKICGITRLEDALFAAQSDAWALGFNFYMKSPRYIAPEQALQIISQVHSPVLKCGIFIDEQPQDVINTMEALGLDYAQVYADLPIPREYKRRMILALQARDFSQLSSEQILTDYAFVLLDAPKAGDGLMGGTGRLANWDLAQSLSQRHRLILAGGLNQLNVREAIEVVKPFAVDVCSGVEKAPGIKDRELMAAFFDLI